MYHNSSQKKFWTFENEECLEKLRFQSNQKFRAKVRGSGKELKGLDESSFLNPFEEDVLFRHYERRLLEFCANFKPVMPKSVVGTAAMYFRRFYLHNSVMEYHPRIIMLTCAYLACKVDEFNVSSSQFVGNLPETAAGQEKALEQILEYELLLIQQLNFHLVVHNPYRPLEGFLIDLKIALTAVLNSASRAGITMESYLAECLGLKDDKETLCKMIDLMRRIKNLLKKYELPNSDEVNMYKQKLERIHAEFVNTIPKRKRGYEDDDHVTKEHPVAEEEEWTDEDLESFMT
ncbi:cyclin-H isoform X2 [Paramormyrops kingsleyae]|uniref:cyclin-H isoform X2 n=1 Tax=Paramormyrops kingsleyae TaxID=1676925 RepID=UPI000CD5D45C|nr:cyclin-H isoform X2 [Paramormyrops kingsleyae]